MKPQVESILACPKCKGKINSRKTNGHCLNCKYAYKKNNGIWELLYAKKTNTLKSKKVYDQFHQGISGRPKDGSYEILAAFSKGNFTVDIACGDGFIQQINKDVVGVEFSYPALLKAKKNGGRYLIHADAHSLPFIDNAFDMSICTGSLEHFEYPEKVIKEMIRVSKIQILIVHRKIPIPFFNLLRKSFIKLSGNIDQPIDNPISEKELIRMIHVNNSHIVYKGLWTMPFTYFIKLPSCHFVVSIKK